MLQRQLLAASAVLLSSLAAHAQTFAFNVSGKQSNIQIDSSLSLAMPGTVIGDYDAVTNPTGTMTRPGLFGGSGNMPVPMDITFLSDLAYAGAPAGSFGAVVDTSLLTIGVENFSLDALAGQSAQTNLTLELLYQTFRTFQPTSLFPGGIPLPLPVGQGTVSGLTFVQNGAALGVLVPDLLIPDTYAVTVLVPTDVSFTVDLLGQVTPVGPLPLAFPLSGTLTVNGGTAQLTLSGAQANTQKIPDPFPGQTIDNFPLAVPTVFPTGSTANLLFNAIFGTLTFDVGSSFDLVANGSAVCASLRICTPTPNSVGSGAVLDMIGTPSVSANNLVMRTSNLPDHRVTVVRFGNQEAQIPFGAGILCVGGTAYRLPVVYSTPAGIADSVVDFSIPSPKYQALVPGSTWYFQCLYRDPLFSNPAGNASDAIRVQICP